MAKKRKVRSKPTVYIAKVPRTANTYWAYKKKKGKKIPLKTGSSGKVFEYGASLKRKGVKIKAKV